LTGLPEEVLVEADLFISYLTGDKFVEKFDLIVEAARAGSSKLFTSSEVFDDVISALRSQKRTLSEAANFVADMNAIPFESIPVTANVAVRAMELYAAYGGRGRLHYFDAFHVATAVQHSIPLATSDLYILRNAETLGVETVNIRRLGKSASNKP
jgi:predicted nucleic acid-binding protein